MSTEDTTSLIEQLRDIHLPQAPEEPSIWPIALAAALFTVALATIVIKRMKIRSSWSKEAINELERIKHQHKNRQAPSDNPTDTLQQTAALLKRIVLTHQPDYKTRHLSGDKWLECLDQFFNTRYFTEGGGQLFGDSLYQQHHEVPDSLYRDLAKLFKRKAWQ